METQIYCLVSFFVICAFAGRSDVVDFLDAKVGVDRRFEQLKKLYSDLGATVSDKIKLYQQSSGVGIGASSNISIGDTLISIPSKLFVSPQRILKLHNEWKDFPRNFQSPYTLLAMFIARVRTGADGPHKDKKNVFDPAEYLYIRYLADKCINGYTIHQKAIEVLPKRGKEFLSNERNIAVKDLNEIQRLFAYIPDETKRIPGFNFPLFMQAMCIASSRAFFSTELNEYVLVPFVDFANHGSNHMNTSYHVFQSNPLHLNLIANENLVEKDQVLTYYGDMPALRQWFNYGFVDEDPRSDKFLKDVEFVLPIIDKERDPNEAIKVSLIRKLRIKNNKPNFYVSLDRRKRFGIFGEDLAILRLMYIAPQDFSAYAVTRALANTRGGFPQYCLVPGFSGSVVAHYEDLEEIAGGDKDIFYEVRIAAAYTRVFNSALLNCNDYVITLTPKGELDLAPKEMPGNEEEEEH